MLRTEHILYRISRELSLPVDAIAAAYACIVAGLGDAARVAAVACGPLGTLTRAPGGALTTTSLVDPCIPFSEAVRARARHEQQDEELVETIRARLVANALDTLARREAVAWRSVGVWEPGTAGATARFTGDFVPEEIADDVPADANSQVVDVPRLIAEVHREMGFDPPCDTMHPDRIDVGALVRIVRNRMPDLPADAAPASDSGPARTLARPAAVGQQGETTRTAPDAFEAVDAGMFENNRERLFHPPAAREGGAPLLVRTLAVLFLLLLVVAVAWFAGLFEAIVPAPPRVELPGNPQPYAVAAFAVPLSFSFHRSESDS